MGGRLNQHDSADFARDNIGYLQLLQSNNAAFIEQDLPKTLARELKEETGLIYKTHYDFKLWRKLKPYRQVEGTAPNHAFTEYYLTLYSIELTLAGYVWLHDKINTDEQLVWFSMAAIENGKTADGKKPYIKALVDDFSGDLTALTAELIKLPDSFTASYLAQINEPNNYALILPINTEQPLLMGFKGKEKRLPVSLTAEQLALLLGLAAHNRGFVFADVVENIRFHPFGWVDVANNAVLKNELIQLAALFKNTALCIENHQDTLFRLSINPAVIYITETVFTFSVQGADLNATKTKMAVTISRQALVTAFGVTQAHAQVFNITLDLAHNLQKLAQQSFLADNVTALKIEDACKKKLHKDPDFLALGLRALIRRDAGLMTFCCPFVVV
jgi:8-oxo-dGTP pyrophosphatase MutT (NUDIX family)